MNMSGGVVIMGDIGGQTTYKYIKKIGYTLDKLWLFNSIKKQNFFLYRK